MYKIIPAPGTKISVPGEFSNVESAIKAVREEDEENANCWSVRYETDENGYPIAFLKLFEEILIIRSMESERLTRHKRLMSRVSRAGCRIMEDEKRIYTMLRYEIVKTNEDVTEPVTGYVISWVFYKCVNYRYFMSQDDAKLVLSEYAREMYLKKYARSADDTRDMRLMSLATQIEVLNSGVYDAGDDGVYTVEEVRIPEPRTKEEWERFLASDVEYSDSETRHLKELIRGFRAAIKSDEDRLFPDSEGDMPF